MGQSQATVGRFRQFLQQIALYTADWFDSLACCYPRCDVEASISVELVASFCVLLHGTEPHLS